MRNWVSTIAMVVWLLASARAQTPVWTWAGPQQLSRSSPTPLLLAGTLNAVAVTTSASGTPLALAGGLGGVWSGQAASWSPTSEAQPVLALAVDPSGTIDAGTSNGLWNSADGGSTWSPLDPDALAGMAVCSVVISGQLIIALTAVTSESPSTAQSGLYLSNNAGASFTLALAGTYQSVAEQGGVILAAGTSAVTLLSSDESASSPVAIPLAGASHVAVASDPGGGFDLLLSTTSGVSLWSVSISGAAVMIASLPTLTGQNALALAIASDGSIWAGGDGQVVSVSTDHGKTWTDEAVGGPNQHQIFMDPQGNIWVADDTGLWMAAPQQAFASQNAGLFNAAPLGFVLGATGAVAALANGALATGSISDWTEIAENGLHLTALTQANATLYALGNQQLWNSVNGGQTWQSLSLANAVAPTALATSSSGVWIGAASGALITPQQGTAHPCTSAVTAISVQASQLWAACGATLATSTDSGVDWQSLPSFSSPVIALASDPAQPGLIAAATSAGILWSQDYGNTWSPPLAIADGAPITALAFDANQTLWASTLGRGIWSANFAALPAPSAVISVQPLPPSVAAGSMVTIQATLTVGGTPLSASFVQYAASEGNQSLVPTPGTNNQFQPLHSGSVDVLISATGTFSSAKPVQVSFQVTPAVPAKLVMISGAGQSAVVGSKLPSPITFEVDDAYGNPVSGVVVSFGSSAGSFSTASASTAANGQASTQFTLPSVPGQVALTASAPDLPSASWSETALPQPDFTLAIEPPSSPPVSGQPAALSVAVASIGGFNQPVSLACVQPASGCQLSSAAVLPGGNASVTVVSPPNQDSLDVVVVGSVGADQHTAALGLSLQAFTMTASAAALAVQAGSKSASIALQLASENGLNGPVSFHLAQTDGSTLPPDLSSIFQPTTVVLATNASATVQFAVSAASSSQATPWIFPDPSALHPPVALCLFCFLGLLLWAAAWRIPLRQRAPSRPGLGVAVAAAKAKSGERPCSRRLVLTAAALTFVFASCGGSPPILTSASKATAQSTTTSYNLQVTATVAGLSASIPVTLTVTSP